MSKKGATSSHTLEAKSGALRHNRREVNLSNVNPHLSHLNESWESPIIMKKKDGGEGRSIDSLTKERAYHYFKKHGRSAPGFGPNGKSVPPDRRTAFIRESCVVIKPETTLEDVRRFADSVCSSFGVKCLGIWLHKDEGYHRSKYIEGDTNWKTNLHAHVLFDWYLPERGTVARSTSDWYSEMQDMAAAALNMERGEKSERKHTASKDFAAQQADQRIAILKDELAKIERSCKAQTTQLNNLKQKIQDAQTRNDEELPILEEKYVCKKQMLEKANSEYDSLQKQIKNLRDSYDKDAEKYHEQLTEAQVDLHFLKMNRKELNIELDALKDQVEDSKNSLDTAIDDYLDTREKLQLIQEQLNQQSEEVSELSDYFRSRENEYYHNIGEEIRSRIVELEQLQIDFAKAAVQISPEVTQAAFKLLPTVSRHLFLDMCNTYYPPLHSFFMGGAAPGVIGSERRKRRGDDDDDEYNNGISR